ncbi:protein kinase domain-containing protein [Gemmatimonas sp.]|uniref:protein kinase domain-containing protein n=1 Tax=Gemmatimonas sp. TaxID=1962908 RepID=UPI003982FED4
MQRLTAAVADRYRVERELGQGGMATVYLAHDLKHERDVAIKVLHPDLGAALGGERFLAEIKTTAKLQHPHILPLLDSGNAGDGLLYYVMPLVTGETLRARLDREQQLPVEDALLIAREVGDALGYAHALGVIHRDIKPENILLRDGHALVADFGIALAVQTAAGARMTQTGLSLGTPQYMSPEQAMGERSIDARSDLYALAAVTYEMLVGEPPFTGPTVQAIVARLLTETPRSLSAQRKAVPESVSHAVMRALEKLPADRFSTAAEFIAALRADAPTPARTSATRSARLRAVPLWALPVVGVVTLVIGALITPKVTSMFRTTPEVSKLVRNLTVALPDSMQVAFKGSVEAPGGQGSVTISADGRRIAWVGVAGLNSAVVRLYVRDMDSYAISAVTGSEEAFAPFLSDDGSRLAYFSGPELHEVNLAKRETRVLARGLVNVYGASYVGNGGILIATETGLLTLTASGGTTGKFARPSVADGGSFGPVSFPSAVAGDQFAVGLVRGGPLVVVSLADGATRTIRPYAGDTATSIYGDAPKVAGGRLYWHVRDAVMSAQFDVDGARMTSEPMVVTTGVRGDLFGAADFDVADDGTVVFVPGADAAIGHLAFLDHQGDVDTLAVPPADYSGFDLSPDGQSLLTKSISAAGATELRLFNVARGAGTNVARGAGTLVDVGAGAISQPGWLADGRSILVSVAPNGIASARLLRATTDGRARPDTIMSGGLDRYAVAPRVGLVIAQVTRNRSPNRYLTDDAAMDTRLYASRDGGAFTELPSLRGLLSPSLSPDGRWVTYERYQSADATIFMERFPLDGHPVRVPGRGYEAYLSPKGGRLFYRVGSGIMQVPLTFTPNGVTFGEPTMWVTFSFADFIGRAYKIANDERVLVKLLPSTKPQGEIRVVIRS